MAHLVNSNYGINQGPQDDYQANRTDPSSQVNLNLYPHGQEAVETQWDRANYAPPPIIPAYQSLADGQPIQTSEYGSGTYHELQCSGDRWGQQPGQQLDMVHNNEVMRMPEHSGQGYSASMPVINPQQDEKSAEEPNSYDSYQSWCKNLRGTLKDFLTNICGDYKAWEPSKWYVKSSDFEFSTYLPVRYKTKGNQKREDLKKKKEKFDNNLEEGRYLAVHIMVLSALYDYIVKQCKKNPNVPGSLDVITAVVTATKNALKLCSECDWEVKYELYKRSCETLEENPKNLKDYRYSENTTMFPCLAKKDIECCKLAVFHIIHLMPQQLNGCNLLTEILVINSTPFKDLLQTIENILGKKKFEIHSDSLLAFRMRILNFKAPSMKGVQNTPTKANQSITSKKNKKPVRSKQASAKKPRVIPAPVQPATVPSDEQLYGQVDRHVPTVRPNTVVDVARQFILHVWYEPILNHIRDCWRTGRKRTYWEEPDWEEPSKEHVQNHIESLTRNFGQLDSVGSFLDSFLCSYPQFGQECMYHLNPQYFHDMIGAAYNNSTVMPPFIHLGASTSHTTWRFSWPQEGTSVSLVFEDLKVQQWYNVGNFCTSCQQHVDYNGEQHVVIPDDLKYFIAVPGNPRTNIPHLQKEEIFFDYKWSLEAVFIWQDNAYYLLLKDRDPLHIMEGDQIVCLVYKKTASASAAASSSYSAAI